LAKLNAGYGSELHLLRMLGRHRKYFDLQVRTATGMAEIDWCDFPSGEMHLQDGIPVWDREWQHLQFLERDDPARLAWDVAWPTHRPGHNWDAIGQVGSGTSREWLLVEAKANLNELSSDCQAKDTNSLETIRQTLSRTKAALGVPEAFDWMRGYYQFCNRLAALNVMNDAGSAARMLFIYSFGDVGDHQSDGVDTRRRVCPASIAGWADALAKQDQHVGLPADHPLKDRLHRRFIDVRCFL
jgi:hypothetical protein